MKFGPPPSIMWACLISPSTLIMNDIVQYVRHSNRVCVEDSK